MKRDTDSSRSIISEVSPYISQSGEKELPAEVITKAKHHILDTLAAIVSGSTLIPGQVARKYAESQPGAEEAQVICSSMVTSAVTAAMANGMMAHADETDDMYPPLLFHPGSVIVPAALAVSEREGADGMSFLRGVVVGYDIGCRILKAMGPDKLLKTGRNTHCFGGSFGAAAAGASIMRLGDEQVRYVLSYAAQQISGMNYWRRDKDHIEKAFLFSGMPARNGVTAAIVVQSGFTGVSDPFSGEANIFEITSPGSRPELLADALGSHFDIMSIYIKKYPVGGPIQAALDALLLLIEKHALKASDVKSLTVYMPYVGPVDNSSMPSVNLNYILAATLLDGNMTFDVAHSYERMSDPAVIDVKSRITLVEDAGFFKDGILRQAIVEITRTDSTKLKQHVVNWRGKTENPMTTEEVVKKSSDLLLPLLGQDRSQGLIDNVLNLEHIRNMRELRPFLSAS